MAGRIVSWLSPLLLGLFVGLKLIQPNLVAHLNPAGDPNSEAIIDATIAIGLWLAGALVVNALIGYLLSGLMARATGRPLPRIVRDFVAVLVLLIALSAIVATVFNRSVAGIWATSGIIGIVIGLAMRPIILDIFAGLAVNLEHPFRISDWVRIDSRQSQGTYAGWIHQVNWRTTQIRTRSGDLVIVPNSIIGTSVVTNYTQPAPESRFEFSIYLDPDVPPGQGLPVILAGAREMIGAENGPLPSPAPVVLIAEAGASGIEYLIRYWIDARTVSEPQAQSVVTRSVLRHLRLAGLRLAHPQQDLMLQRAAAPDRDHRSPEYLANLLHRVKLFAELTSEELGFIVESAQVHKFAEGELVVHEAEDGDSMFVLAEGLLSIRVKHNADEAGRKVAHLGPGEFFGEMSMLTGEPRSATVAAVCDAVVIEIRRETMEHLLKQRPEIANTLSRTVAERRMHMTRTLEREAPQPDDGASETLAAQILHRMRAFFGV